MSVVTKVTKHFTNTKSWSNKHVLLYSFSPLCIAVRFDTHAARLLILITRIYWFWTTRNEPYRDNILHSPESLSCSTRRTSDTLKRSINSLFQVRKFSVSSERSRNFRLYLHFYWLFPCSLTKIKLKVSCLICITKYINAVIFMGSHSTYKWTRFAEIICVLNLFNITPSL